MRNHLEPIFMPLGDVLYEPGTPISHLYFPTTAVISISCVLIDGRADAIALIGPEGVAGIEAILGSKSASFRAVVLSEGWGHRVRREFLDRECGHGGSVPELLLRYAQSYVTQIAQMSVCNRHHTIDQQLCRWLLMLLDRHSSKDIALTQERIADLMGIRRESVTAAAQKLVNARAIRYHRGQISVLDRVGLKIRSCECYGVVTRESERLLGVWHPHAIPTLTHTELIRGRSGRSPAAATPVLRALA